MNYRMKTFTYKQAIAELTKIFGSYEVTDKVDTTDRLEVYFTTSDGQSLCLLADDSEYFQRFSNYEIFEA
mgnify:FL=1